MFSALLPAVSSGRLGFIWENSSGSTLSVGTSSHLLCTQQLISLTGSQVLHSVVCLPRKRCSDRKAAASVGGYHCPQHFPGCQGDLLPLESTSRDVGLRFMVPDSCCDSLCCFVYLVGRGRELD